MKKILLTLAVISVLVSCSGKDEVVKEATFTEIVVSQEKKAQDITSIAREEQNKIKKISESTLNSLKQTRPFERPLVEGSESEKSDEDKKIDTETSIDEIVDNDVDKKISKSVDESKEVKVESDPIEKEESNKTVFGVLGVLLVAIAAFFVFKKK